MSQSGACPSPQATTSAILGASTSGWSPTRTARRPNLADSILPSSPQRVSMSSNYAGSDAGVSSSNSPQVPTHRANIAVLRSHGLVSNSIFRSGNPSPTQSSNVSPMGSPTRQSPFTDRQRGTGNMGVGLGIKPQTDSPTRMMGARTTSNSSITSSQSASDVENEEIPVQRSPFRSNSPRKSKGISKLEKASYVSNSPFRKQLGTSTETQDRPLELPNNAWAASAAVARISPESPTRLRPDLISGIPRTPERTPQRTATALSNGDSHPTSPTSLSGTPRGAFRNTSSIDSPSNRGLLVSNRLHGPRIMDANSGTSTPQESPLRKERRKTVTFDEVLDVQEFDRESSFDGHSLQSASSVASSLNVESEADKVGSPDEEMWLRNGASRVVEKLMIVNGSPDTLSSTFSTPDLESSQQTSQKRQDSRHQMQSSDMMESSSTDSRELSSIDEPRSPPPEEMSFDYEHGDKTFNTAPDVSYFNESLYAEHDSDLSGGNLSAYGALHRVDSLVDELLEGDLLGKKNQTVRQKDCSDSPPRRRRAGSVKVAEQERSKPLPTVPLVPAQQSSTVQLSLPIWSPLMPAGDYTATSKEAAEVVPNTQISLEKKEITPPAITTSRPAQRPHISRDAILQRVAREKMMQEEEVQQSSKASGETKEEGVAPAKSQNAIVTRRSEGSALITRSGSGTITGPKAPASAAVERKEVAPLNAFSTIALPAATVQVPAADLESPLERLGVEVAAEQNEASASNLERLPSLAGSESTKRQERWFDERSVDESFSTQLSPSALGGDMPKLTPAQQAEMIIARRRSKNGKSTLRPKARRSLSEGGEGGKLETIESMEKVAPVFHDAGNDAELMEEELVRNRHLLDASLKGAIDNGFETGLEREISRIYHQGEHKYNVNDRGTFVSNSKPEEKVAHSTQAGDVDGGKAWRRLRRPSDMNEYAKEMREYRENENPKKAAGKVFVLVDSFVPSSLPVPNKPTRFYCILDNGLHVVKTATAALRPGSAVASKIGQEFELIQHRNLEFSLTLVVQRDAHLQEPQPESPSSVRKMTPSFSRGMSKLFSSPKKKAAFAASGTTSSMASTMSTAGGVGVEPMLSYINKEGAFGRADVVFEKVAQQCLANCLTLDIPVRGVNDPAPSLSSALQKTTSIDFSRNIGKIRGTLRLKLFYLPPMPSVPRNLMPQNLGDCIRGMEAAKWHSGEAWMEGTLTQLGGDCVSWRRRPVKAQGAHLIGYNEITKKPTIKIDLRKAMSIEQTHDPVNNAKGSRIQDDEEELDETYHVERSFRITFKDGEKISFFADTDAEMQKWMEALKKVVGNKDIPNACVWATVATDMIKAAKEKSNLAKSSSNAVQISKRLSTKTTNESPSQSPQATRSSSSQSKIGPPPSASSLSSQFNSSHRIPRVPVPTALSAVPESTSTTPEQTPTRRRPMSVALPSQQPPRQSSLNQMGTVRTTSVYVDGRS